MVYGNMDDHTFQQGGLSEQVGFPFLGVMASATQSFE
jgi:hypothetical protein